jgi:methylated-DNA-[protein]-cysteine S-methyltransferase
MNNPPETLYWREIGSPIGRLLLVGDGASLIRLHFQSGPKPLAPEKEWIEQPASFETVTGQLSEYFQGRRRTFDLPLAPRGTQFQRHVWLALREIPYGETISYGELARRIGKPSASRAVGLANGANPLPIIVPCHRVIGADGTLTGFGGGLAVKRKLLALESEVPQSSGRAQQSFGWPTRTPPPG